MHPWSLYPSFSTFYRLFFLSTWSLILTCPAYMHEIPLKQSFCTAGCLGGIISCMPLCSCISTVRVLHTSQLLLLLKSRISTSCMLLQVSTRVKPRDFQNASILYPAFRIVGPPIRTNHLPPSHPPTISQRQRGCPMRALTVGPMQILQRWRPEGRGTVNAKQELQSAGYLGSLTTTVQASHELGVAAYLTWGGLPLAGRLAPFGKVEQNAQR